MREEPEIEPNISDTFHFLYVNVQAYVDELTLQHLRNYVVHLQQLPSKQGQGLSDTTVQQYAKHIRAFCRWLEQEDVMEKRITTRFKVPRAEKKLITALTPEDIDKLLEACDE